MTVRIDLRQYPGWLADKADQFPFAASQALNDTGFRLKRDLEARAQSDLDFKRAARPALGIRVDRSSKKNLVTVVKSERGWLETQVSEGITRPVRGIRHKGSSYLLIPKPGSKKTRQGRLKGITARARLFIVESGGDLVMLARFSSTRLQTVGILVKEADFADDYGWEDQSDETIERFMADRFAFRMARALRSRR